MNDLRVEAYAGHRYPERPDWVTWKGERQRVEEIEGEWRQPGHVLFRVRLEDGQRLLLSYREAEDAWAAIPAGPPFGGRQIV